MQTRIGRFIIALMPAVAAAGLVSGCSSPRGGSAPSKEIRVSLAELSGPARATVVRVTRGGTVDQIDREVERGKAVYDVEATMGGKHVEFLIGDADGAVLGTEVPIDYSELPEAVRASAASYFGGATGLKSMKGVEYGETSYEIEGKKNGKTVEITFDSKGRRAQ